MATLGDEIFPQLVKDAQGLVKAYIQSAQVRNYINQALDQKKLVTYKGRPVILYLKVISRLATENAQLRGEYQVGERYRQAYQAAKRQPEKIKDFLTNFYRDDQRLKILDNSLQKNTWNNSFDPEEAKSLSEIEKQLTREGDKKPLDPQRDQKFISWTNTADKTIPQQPAIPSPETPQEAEEEGEAPSPQDQILKVKPTAEGADNANLQGNISKKAASKLQIFTLGVLNSLKTSPFLKNTVSSLQLKIYKIINSETLKSILKKTGKVASTSVRATFSVASQEIANSLKSPPAGGNEAVDTAPSEAENENRSSARRGSPLDIQKIIPFNGIILGIAIVLIITALYLLLFGAGGGGGLGPMSGSGGSSGGSVNQCRFTRAGNAQTIASTKLQNAISEVAGKTGVPAAVLASVAMHESQTFVSGAQDNHDVLQDNYQPVADDQTECRFFPTSDNGALGLMQVIPPPDKIPTVTQNGKVVSYDRNLAVSVDGITRGLNFLGRNLDSLTISDFCDLKTNLYLGAGVLLSKNGGNPPTTSQAVESTVCNYFGNICTYGGSYNYGKEAAQDFQSCSSAGLPPPPLLGGDYRKWILDNFQIVINPGFKNQDNVYRYAYEVLKETYAKAPKFAELLKQAAGGPITIIPINDISHRQGNTIYFRHSLGGDEILFKLLLIHELSHIIHGSAGGSSYGKDLQQVIASDPGGYLTAYSQGATPQSDLVCDLSLNPNDPGVKNTRTDEDFSESVAYWVNSSTAEKNQALDGSCGEVKWKGINPYTSGKYPAHQAFIKSIFGGN